MRRLRWITATLAAPLLLAGQALADFTYTTSTVPASQTFGAASTAQFGATGSNSTLSGSQGIALAVVADQTTASPGNTDTTGPGQIQITDTITITHTPGHGSTGTGSGTLTLVGVVSWSRSDTGGQLSSFSFTSLTSSTGGSTLTIGNTTYSLGGYSYTQPTVNQPLTSTSAGSISGILGVAMAVPEPSSLAALCVGGLLLGAPVLRRHVRRIARTA